MVKRLDYISQVLFCMFMESDEGEVHYIRLTEKERGQYSAILSDQAWSMEKRILQ